LIPAIRSERGSSYAFDSGAPDVINIMILESFTPFHAAFFSPSPEGRGFLREETAAYIPSFQ
jgi:hypothetical protein